MTVTEFLVILGVCSAVTSILTEGIKHALDGIGARYASNIVVLIVALLVGGAVTAAHYANNGIPLTSVNCAYIAMMGIANWLGATIGYDKVRQTVAQILRK